MTRPLCRVASSLGRLRGRGWAVSAGIQAPPSWTPAYVGVKKPRETDQVGAGLSSTRDEDLAGHLRGGTPTAIPDLLHMPPVVLALEACRARLHAWPTFDVPRCPAFVDRRHANLSMAAAGKMSQLNPARSSAEPIASR